MKNSFWKKGISVLLTVLMMLGCFSVALASGAQTPQLYYYIFDERDAQGNLVPAYYTDAQGRRIPDPQPSGVAAAEDDLPTSYDARTENIITTPKYQAGSGSCWAFTTISCMETSMIKQGYLTLADADYSEAYMTWFGQRQRALDPNDPTYGDGRNIGNPFTYGGNWQHSSATLMRGSGVQLESNAPWIETRDATVMMQMEQPESDRYLSYARVKQTETTKDRDTAKRLIMSAGSVYTAYYDDTGITDLGYNKTNTCYYQTVQTTTNHAVALIGWDDNYPATNFNDGRQPSANGAWLCKGSWSTRYGNNGYYWISYEEPTCTEFTAFTAMPADTYDHIYQYDGAFCSAGWTNISTSATIANLFHASDMQDLTHVAVYNPNYGTTVKVQVYTGGTSHTLTGNNPTSNMTLRAAKTVYDVNYGYTTVELNNPIRLQSGEAFTVAVTLTNPNGGDIRVPIENVSPSTVTETTITRGGNVGESFVNFGSGWYDTNNYNGTDYNNVPVKAMTRDVETVPPTLSLVSAPDQTTYTVGDTLDATGLVLSYSNEYGETTMVTYDYTGLILSPTTLNTVGTQTITATYQGLSVTFDVTVQPPATGEICVSSGEAYPGQSVDVTITATANPGIVTARLFVQYDATALELTGVQNGVIFGNDYFIPGNDLTLVPYNLVWLDALSQTNYTATGTLATLTFRVRETAAAGAAPITVTVDEGSTNDVDLVDVPFTVQNGAVTVKALETPTLTLVSAPDQTDYTVGDTLDTTGLTLSYSDAYGVVSTVTDGIVCTPTLLNTAGTQTITATYQGLSVTFDVTVQQPPVQDGLLTVSSAEAYPGEEIQVTITAAANPGIVTTRLFVQYDATALELTGAQNGVIFPNTCFTAGNDLASNPYILIWMDALSQTNYTATGTLATLTFRVRETAAAGATPITVTLDETSTFNVDLQNVPFTAQSGTVTVKALATPTLSLVSAPDQTDYTLGDTLDTTGLVLSYSDAYGVVSTVTAGFVCTPTSLDTAGTQTITVTYQGLSVTFDVTVQQPQVQQPVLVAKTGAPTVIDDENGFIYGLELELDEATLRGTYLDVEGGGSFRVIYTAYIATGTTVQLLDSDGNVAATYQIVLFGDVDGDGTVTLNDFRAVKGHVSGAAEFEEGSAQMMAGDMDGDGVVDMQDAAIMKSLITGANEIDQATRRLI